jgi:hypothetical protein
MLPTFPSRRTPPTGIGLPPGSSDRVHPQDQGVAGDPGVLPTASLPGSPTSQRRRRRQFDGSPATVRASPRASAESEHVGGATVLSVEAGREPGVSQCFARSSLDKHLRERSNQPRR